MSKKLQVRNDWGKWIDAPIDDVAADFERWAKRCAKGSAEDQARLREVHRQVFGPFGDRPASVLYALALDIIELGIDRFREWRTYGQEPTTTVGRRKLPRRALAWEWEQRRIREMVYAVKDAWIHFLVTDEPSLPRIDHDNSPPGSLDDMMRWHAAEWAAEELSVLVDRAFAGVTLAAIHGLFSRAAARRHNKGATNIGAEYVLSSLALKTKAWGLRRAGAEREHEAIERVSPRFYKPAVKAARRVTKATLADARLYELTEYFPNGLFG